MKKITAFTIAAAMAFCLTACGDSEKKPADAQQGAKTSSENDDSKTSREDMLKAANANAKTGYNAVAEYLADMEVQGKLSEATEQEAVDMALKELEMNSNISGTVGVRFDESGDYGFLNFTVQFRAEEDSTVIGQYPDPAQSLDDMPEWNVGSEGECAASTEDVGSGSNGRTFGDAIGDVLTGGYISKSKQSTANGNAKTAYNAVAEYLADLEVEGKLSTASEQAAAEFAAKELDYGSAGIVGVKFDGDIENFEFHTLWRRKENSGPIGRYPEPVASIDEYIEWDAGAEVEYNSENDVEDTENDGLYETPNNYISSSKLKTAITNAKTAYSAVEVYIGDMETKGELSEVTEQSAADVAAAMLKDYEISGIIGVTITDLYHDYPQFEVFWRESEDSNIVGKYPYPPQSVDDCPEWDVGAYSYVK